MDNRDQIEEIKSKLDIVSIVQHYVPSLKRSGRNHFGLCPFHNEKTPSFSVNSEIGVFKCFGCGEGGDVIKFIEKVEGLDFPKALELAANKAGVKLKRSFTPESAVKQVEKDRLLEANHLTAEYYNYILLKHSIGEAGRVYAKQRKLEKDIIKKFMIGYAPASFENLKNFLLKKGFTLSELVKWGLLVEKNGKIYDKFRNRLMFTITDHQGDIVGFTGRMLDANDMGPKYLNTSETLVYKKSKILYGLFQAKEAIRKNGYVIIVEGNVDPLTSHQVGVENIVAPMGTALTPEQLTLLKRYCDKVYFALDTDAAGQKALRKDMELINTQNMQAYILDLGKFKDVDDLIVNGGDWPTVLSKPIEAVTYFMNALLKKYDLSKTFEKRKYVQEILELIALSNDRIIQSDYLQKLANNSGIEIRILIQELQSYTSQRDSHNFAKVNVPDSLNKLTVFGEKIEEFDVLSRYLLALIIEHKGFHNAIKEYINVAELPTTVYQNLYRGIWDPAMIKGLSAVEQNIFAEINLMSVPTFASWEEFIKELHQVQKRIKREQIHFELEQLRAKQADLQDNPQYLTRLKELTAELSKLKNSL